MTLHRQLWLAIVLSMSFAFIGSFVVSSLSAKSYLQQQLFLKNIDNANSLALTLSNGDSDPVTMELMLNAQYDSGHYKFIRFIDTSGNVVIDRSNAEQTDSVPAWLVSFFPIEPKPATAHISDGWRQLGTLTLQSHARFAYQELWASSKRLAGYFAVAALIAGVIGSVLLKIITQPLDKVVGQARAMGERRFITLPTPRTLEFKTLTEEMNRLSERVKNLLADESSRLDSLRKSIERDGVSGLINRGPFLEQLSTILKSEDGSSSGSIAIVRLLHLAELNRLHSRPVMDQLLKQFGQQLLNLQTNSIGIKPLVLGRLNGSDFAVLAPQNFEPEKLAFQIRDLLLADAEELEVGDPPVIAAAAGPYQTEDTISTLLSRIDAALAIAESLPEGGVELATSHLAASMEGSQQLGVWGEIIEEALTQRKVTLANYPVRDRNNNLLHWEAPAQLISADNSILSASQFMPWVNRLDRCSDFDSLTIELALEAVSKSQMPLAVNLSAHILGDEAAMHRVTDLLKSQPENAAFLWLEVPENGVYHHLQNYRLLSESIKTLGCKLGVERVGAEVSRIGELHNLGLDYLKLDPSLCVKINENQGNQIFIRGLSTIAHSIGLMIIAEGVSEQSDWDCLCELGIDGGMGELFS